MKFIRSRKSSFENVSSEARWPNFVWSFFKEFLLVKWNSELMVKRLIRHTFTSFYMFLLLFFLMCIGKTEISPRPVGFSTPKGKFLPRNYDVIQISSRRNFYIKMLGLQRCVTMRKLLLLQLVLFRPIRFIMRWPKPLSIVERRDALVALALWLSRPNSRDILATHCWLQNKSQASLVNDN